VKAVVFKRAVNYIFIAACAFLFPLLATAQSTDANFPTVVTTNEIVGTIKARDIGDSRATTYYYTFDGGQGDVFVNIVTNNFSGDVDVFVQEGQRPLTKMVVYPDNGPTETGRVIYMRKPERLILRIEGRSPNDDAATFRIKFAGSFIALAPQKQADSPSIKPSETDADAGVRVNSVGTIVAVIPKPQPTPAAKATPKETVAVIKRSPPAQPKPAKPATPSKETVPKKTTPTKAPPARNTVEPVTKPVQIVKSEPPAKTIPTKPGGDVATVFKKVPGVKAPSGKPTKPAQKSKQPAEPKPNPDPLAKIHLVVELRDGNVIQRAMSEVQTFSVDNGQLTVVAKDGTSVKYSILDVAKVTIE